MKFCSQCGNAVQLKVPDDDNRERYVCDHCDIIHYQNPNNVCGVILTSGSKVLLCKRAIEPRHGRWTLPGGFMENNETVSEAAAREAMEEANAQSGALQLFGVFSMPYISQVHLMFHGDLLSDDVSPGVESLEVALFEQRDIPWDDLAFPVIRHSLELFYEQGTATVHHAWYSRNENRSVDLHIVN
ncbi:MAG: ADP-ribose pyrophosphatase YjhB (NUDIX family) [Planctomycetota bacterium]|jgi:ADP-ribose pyrophosphatase YjhB (NUDIX family)